MLSRSAAAAALDGHQAATDEGVNVQVWCVSHLGRAVCQPKLAVGVAPAASTGYLTTGHQKAAVERLWQQTACWHVTWLWQPPFERAASMGDIMIRLQWQVSLQGLHVSCSGLPRYNAP